MRPIPLRGRFYLIVERERPMPMIVRLRLPLAYVKAVSFGESTIRVVYVYF